MCLPSCLSPALILAQRCPSQETHNFQGKQSCYYAILLHRCSVLTDRQLMQAVVESEWLLMPVSHHHTQTLFCNVSAFSKGNRVPYHWFCSQLACNSSLHRLMHQTHKETLFVFHSFLFMILNHKLILSLQLWGLEQTVPTKIKPPWWKKYPDPFLYVKVLICNITPLQKRSSMNIWNFYWQCTN